MSKVKSALLVTTLAVGVALAGGSAYAADLMHAAAPGVVQAPAPEGMYVSVFAGAAFAADPTGIYDDFYAFKFPETTGYVIGGTVGTHVSPNLRAELELSYVSHQGTGFMTIDDETGTTGTGSFNTLYVLGNAWYDFDTGSAFTPYIGGGAGLAVIMPDITNIFDDANDYEFKTAAVAPAAQVGAGFKYQIADNIALDVGYRAKFVFNGTLQESGVFGSDKVTNLSYVDQTVSAGLTFGF